jgi:hypothetical protein
VLCALFQEQMFGRHDKDAILLRTANPFSHTTAQRSTQPLTEMSTRNLPADKGRPARKVHKITAICERTVYKMWQPRRFTILWASTACYRDSVAFFLTHEDRIKDAKSS